MSRRHSVGVRADLAEGLHTQMRRGSTASSAASLALDVRWRRARSDHVVQLPAAAYQNDDMRCAPPVLLTIALRPLGMKRWWSVKLEPS
jgi:hypothetical protein